MLLSSVDCFKTPKDLIRLWRNECLRILHDRLISVEDKMEVQAKLNEIVSSNFPGFAESVLADPILFGDYRNAFKVCSKQRIIDEVPLAGHLICILHILFRN